MSKRPVFLAGEGRYCSYAQAWAIWGPGQGAKGPLLLFDLVTFAVAFCEAVASGAEAPSPSLSEDTSSPVFLMWPVAPGGSMRSPPKSLMSPMDSRGEFEPQTVARAARRPLVPLSSPNVPVFSLASQLSKFEVEDPSVMYVAFRGVLGYGRDGV